MRNFLDRLQLRGSNGSFVGCGNSRRPFLVTIVSVVSPESSPLFSMSWEAIAAGDAEAFSTFSFISALVTRAKNDQHGSRIDRRRVLGNPVHWAQDPRGHDHQFSMHSSSRLRLSGSAHIGRCPRPTKQPPALPFQAISRGRGALLIMLVVAGNIASRLLHGARRAYSVRYSRFQFRGRFPRLEPLTVRPFKAESLSLLVSMRYPLLLLYSVRYLYALMQL